MENKEKKGFLTSVKNFVKNNKIISVVGGASLFATSSYANVTFDATTGSFSGEISLTPFYTIAGVIILALGAIYAVKVAMSLIKK